MTAPEWLAYLLLAFFLGAAGQLLRVAVGLKKLHEKNAAPGIRIPFDARKLWISLALGALAGMIVALAQWKQANGVVLSPDFLLTLMASGYAGSDIIEGLMTKSIRMPSDEGKTSNG